MAEKPPILDGRNLAFIMKQLGDSTISELKKRDPSLLWNTDPAKNSGAMLHMIYARFLELVIERLNKVPEKTFFAFLDAMGITLLPPSPAKVPLKFSLSKDSPPVLVHAGTKAAVKGVEKPIIFETEENITVVPSNICRIITVDPVWRRYSDHSDVVREENEVPFSPFIGKKKQQFALYIGKDDFLDFKTGEVTLDFATNDLLNDIAFYEINEIIENMEWEYISQGISRKTVLGDVNIKNFQTYQDITKRGFSDINTIDETQVKGISAEPDIYGGVKGRWLTARLSDSSPDFKSILSKLSFSKITMTIQGKDLLPDAAANSFSPIELNGVPFRPFGDVPKINDCFYFSFNEAFSKTGNKSFNARFNVDVKESGFKLRIEQCVGDGTWQQLKVVDINKLKNDDGLKINPVNLAKLSPDKDKHPKTCELLESFKVGSSLNGYDFSAIRVTMDGSIPEDVYHVFAIKLALLWFNNSMANHLIYFTSDRKVDNLINAIEYGSEPGLKRLVNNTGEDKTFFPFGKKPETGKTLYIVIPSAFRNKGNFHVFNLASPVKLKWEYPSEGGIWKELNVSDKTYGFTYSNHIEINDANSIKIVPCEVNGISNYWIRARIEEGNYGVPLVLKLKNENKVDDGYEVEKDTGHITPPEINTLKLTCYQAACCPRIISQTGFYMREMDNDGNVNSSPFDSEYIPLKYRDEKQTLYLGFDSVYPEQPVSMYFVSTPKLFTNRESGNNLTVDESSGGKNLLVWEYFNGELWKKLPVVDNTSELYESGTVRFLMPKDIAMLEKIDMNPCYMIRVYAKSEVPFDTRRIKAVYLNTVSASQAEGIKDERLGSSNARANQVFKLVKTPVLPGQEIYVNEPEMPTGKELECIYEEEGQDAVLVIENEISAEKEVWVRWHEVSNFYNSGPYSRHYVIDRTLGEIKFGDGKNGLIPPKMVNNIKANYYVTSGDAGNTGANAITKLITSIPQISGVTNPEPADGGAEAESIEMVKDRGPQSLKNRNRAISKQDFEWLVREAAGNRVSRVTCLSNRTGELSYKRGHVCLVIVPSGNDAKPVPGTQLIKKISDFLKKRTLAGMMSKGSSKVSIIGPGYIKVEVEVEIVPNSMDDPQKVKLEAINALNRFIHPIKGGPEEKGWDFGRDVYASEICGLLESIPGVDHVNFNKLKIRANNVQKKITLQVNNFAESSAQSYIPAESALVFKSGNSFLSVILAEPVNFRGGILDIKTKGLKEGDRITLVKDYSVRKDSENIFFDAVDNSDISFPAGSKIKTFDAKYSSRLKNDRPKTQYSIYHDDLGIKVSDIYTDVDFMEAVKLYETVTLFYPLDLTVVSISYSSNGNIIAGIEPFDGDTEFLDDVTVSTHDNKVRYKIAGFRKSGEKVTSLELADIKKGDGLLGIYTNEEYIKTDRMNVAGVETIEDTAYIDSNYLVYSGKHSVDIVIGD